MGEVLWILGHIRDVMADFRAVMHLGWADACRLPAPEFLALAYRLPSYPGVLAARAESQRTSHNGRALWNSSRTVPGTKTAILSDPVLASVVSFGGA